jgi:hypothetical protein
MHRSVRKATERGRQTASFYRLDNTHKVYLAQFTLLLDLEDGTDTLSRIVVNGLPFDAA